MNDLELSGAEIMNALKMTTLNIKNMSEQMGLMVSSVKDMSGRMEQIEGRMQTYEDNLRVTRSQGKNIRAAVIRRVNDLLHIDYENGHVAYSCIDDEQKYRGGFISRCYSDCKHAGVMAESYWETPRGDYDKLIEYIEAWYPQVSGGVEEYKRYLDIRREEKLKR